MHVGLVPAQAISWQSASSEGRLENVPALSRWVTFHLKPYTHDNVRETGWQLKNIYSSQHPTLLKETPLVTKAELQNGKEENLFGHAVAQYCAV